MRLESLMNAVRVCLKQFLGWERKYKDEINVLKMHKDHRVRKMEADLDLLDKS